MGVPPGGKFNMLCYVSIGIIGYNYNNLCNNYWVLLKICKFMFYYPPQAIYMTYQWDICSGI